MKAGTNHPKARRTAHDFVRIGDGVQLRRVTPVFRQRDARGRFATVETLLRQSLRKGA